MKINNDIEKRLWAAADQLWANSNPICSQLARQHVIRSGIR